MTYFPEFLYADSNIDQLNLFQDCNGISMFLSHGDTRISYSQPQSPQEAWLPFWPPGSESPGCLDQQSSLSAEAELLATTSCFQTIPEPMPNKPRALASITILHLFHREEAVLLSLDIYFWLPIFNISPAIICIYKGKVATKRIGVENTTFRTIGGVMR